jgi:hypothetical protein
MSTNTAATSDMACKTMGTRLFSTFDCTARALHVSAAKSAVANVATASAILSWDPSGACCHHVPSPKQIVGTAAIETCEISSSRRPCLAASDSAQSNRGSRFSEPDDRFVGDCAKAPSVRRPRSLAPSGSNHLPQIVYGCRCAASMARNSLVDEGRILRRLDSALDRGSLSLTARAMAALRGIC